MKKVFVKVSAHISVIVMFWALSDADSLYAQTWTANWIWQSQDGPANT